MDIEQTYMRRLAQQQYPGDLDAMAQGEQQGLEQAAMQATVGTLPQPAMPEDGQGSIREIPRNVFQQALGKFGEALTAAGVQLDKVGIDIPALGRVTLKDLTIGESGKVVEDISYGFMPTRGAGGIGGTAGLKPEALELLNLPVVASAAKVAGKGAIAAGKGTIDAVRRAIQPRADIPYERLRASEPLPSQQPGLPVPAPASVDVQPVQTVQLPDGRFGTVTQLSEIKKLRTGYETADSPESVAHLTAGLRKSPQEQMVAVVVDENNKPLQVIRHTIGTSGSTEIEPWALVGAIANVPGARSFWLSHNHPGGTANLSSADINLGKYVQELTRDTGIELRGIMAIAKDKFAFNDLRGNDIQNVAIPPKARNQTVSFTERTLKRTSVLDKTMVTNQDDARRVADQIAGDETGVILFNAQLQPTGFIPISEDKMTGLRQSGEAKRLFQAIEKANAPRSMLVSKKDLTEEQISNVAALFFKAQSGMFDVLTGPQRDSYVGLQGRIPQLGTFKGLAPIGVGVTAASLQDTGGQ